MEYLEDRGLAAVLREKGPLSEEEVIGAGMEICLAFEYAHS